MLSQCAFLFVAGFQYMSDGLSTEDKITLCIIRNYLDFKVYIYTAISLSECSYKCPEVLVLFMHKKGMNSIT